MTLDPSGRFAYVTNTGSANVSGFKVSSLTGALTSLGAPFPAGTGPAALAVDPWGRFAYVANTDSNNVSAYVIQANGILKQVTGSPYGSGRQPRWVAVDPSGRFVYAANIGANTMSAYVINQSTGALSPAGGTTYSTGNFPGFVTVIGQLLTPW